MSDKVFTDKFPTFKDSAVGKEVSAIISDKYRGRLRALISAEDAVSRGAVQELNRLHVHLFGVDIT